MTTQQQDYAASIPVPYLATSSTIAPIEDSFLLLLDTPFEDWPSTVHSFTEGLCSCCYHLPCIND